MRAWTVLLPHFLFVRLAKWHCEKFYVEALMGRVVRPRPGVFIQVDE
ncbi:hypothetical protein SAMN04487844_14725 [Methylobacterium sp. yr596]|nr:hypothetical protein SAMN04487844_14725 [Methylobacterium sp. yr596]